MSTPLEPDSPSSRPRRGHPLLRHAALLVACGVLAAAYDPPRCGRGDTSTWAVETSCGPAGTITLSYDDYERRGCCGGCWAFVEAAGANAVGLPEQGEISAGEQATFAEGDFALVGPVPLAGASPPAAVERVCRFEASADGTRLLVECTGEAPEAACAGTLTRVVPPEET